MNERISTSGEWFVGLPDRGLRVRGRGGAEYAIHEAHYDDDGVNFVTQNPVGVMSETLEGLREEMEWIARALDAPPLRYEEYRVPMSERGDVQPMRAARDDE